MSAEAIYQPDNHAPATGDLYPSRTGDAPAILERQDPVVYAPADASRPLSGEQVEGYRRDGFLILDGLFDAVEVRLLQEELARLHGAASAGSERLIAEPGARALRSLFAIHQSDSLFSRLARDSRLVDVARYLLGDEVYIHQSRLNYKPGFRGKEFYWHSDFETWHVEDGMPRMRALSMSVMLTENTPNNGPLMLIPGSHHRFITCAGRTPERHFRQSLRKQKYGVPEDDLLMQLVEQRGIATAEAAPGASSCLIAIPCTVPTEISPQHRARTRFSSTTRCATGSGRPSVETTRARIICVHAMRCSRSFP